MGWPVLSLGSNFYALVMGIWCRIVRVCGGGGGGGRGRRVSLLFCRRADAF